MWLSMNNLIWRKKYINEKKCIINSLYIHIDTILEKLPFYHVNSINKCLYD